MRRTRAHTGLGFELYRLSLLYDLPRVCLALADKAGGKKFSKDFEEGSAQLQEFVKFFDKQSKTGPPLLEALSHADIFYEMQYKEVKIVANVSDRGVFVLIAWGKFDKLQGGCSVIGERLMERRASSVRTQAIFLCSLVT